MKRTWISAEAWTRVAQRHEDAMRVAIWINNEAFLRIAASDPALLQIAEGVAEMSVRRLRRATRCVQGIAYALRREREALEGA